MNELNGGLVMADWLPVLVAQAWQVTLLIVVVATINRWVGKSRPHFAHLLWLVVLVKCVTPPIWSSPSGLFCWLQPAREVIHDEVVVEATTRSWSELMAMARKFDSTDDGFHGETDANASKEAVESLLGAGEFNVPVEATPAELATNEFDWRSVLLIVWGVASLVVIGVAVVRWLQCWQLVRNTSQRECGELSRQLDSLAKQLGLRCRVRLIVTESRLGPAVIGLFRTTVLLPARIVDRLTQRNPVAPRQECRTSFDLHQQDQASETFVSQLRDGSPVAERQGYFRQDYGSLAPILAHELLHIRRGDLWVGLLQTLAQAVWWCHPLVWWVNRRTTREAERCCDEEVLAELGCDPAAYARALVDVLELKRELKPVPVFPGVRPVEVTTQRLERIMQLGQGCQRRTPWWCWLLAGVVAAATWPGAAFVVTAEDDDANVTTETNRVANAAPLADSNSSLTIESNVVRGVGVNSNVGVAGQIVYEKIGEAPAIELPHPLPSVAPAKLSERQILLQFHVYEVDAEGLKELGIKLGRAKTTWGGTKTRTVAPFQADQDAIAKLGKMVHEKRVKVLSSPAIQTLDGHTANFLCGGEFPVPAVVGIGGEKEAATTFRGFGLQLTATPTIVGPDSLRVSFTWSDSKVANEPPSGATAVAPTLVSQSIQSELLVKPKQPVILGPLGEPGAKGKQLIATLVAEIVESNGRPAPTDAKIEKRVHFEQTTLVEVLGQLAKETGQNIVLDKSGLEEQGVSIQEPVMLSVEGIKLTSALKLMLDPLNLGYRVEESGVIVVTSQRRVIGQPTVVTYAVADLVTPIPNRVKLKLGADLRAADEESKPNDLAKPMMLPMRELIKLITSTCQPDSWSERNGEGSIKANDSTLSLVVRQTKAVHDEIRDLLGQMRRLQDLQAALHVETLTVPADFWQQVGKDFDVVEPDAQPNPQQQGKPAPQRVARLTKKEAALLRSLVRPESAPKVTLFNGQELELFFGGESPTMRLALKPFVGADLKGLRLQLAATKPDAELDFAKLPQIVIETGHSLLLDVTELYSVGMTSGAPTLSKVPYTACLFKNTGQALVVEEEEELLGVPK